MKKKIILPIIIIAFLGGIVYQTFFKKEKSAFTLAEVIRGNVSQEISETGRVESGEKINLSLQNSGKIEKIYVKVGEEVTAGQKLMKLETTQLSLQLIEAEANVSAQEARLSELKRGTRPEEIQISQTSLDKANDDLSNFYNDVSVILNQAYNLADSGIRQQIAALFLYRTEASTPYYDLTYKYCDNQAAADAVVQRKISEDKLNVWRTELQNLNNTPQTLDKALSQAEEYLKVLQNFLNKLNDTLNTDCKLSSEDITKINTYKSAVNLATTNLNTALTSVFSQKKTIEAQKLIVRNYQDQLSLKLAGSTQEQIIYQEALLKQAEAGAALLRNQIQESTLCSPVAGLITEIKKKEGETVQAVLQDAVIVLLPASPYEVEVNIYEEDVVKVKIDDSVDISLVAFPEQIFKGKVIAIDPAEKLIEGVVYYKVIVAFEELPEEVKPGMTADVVIKTATKENVLMITKDAIQKKDDKTMVQVLKDGKIQDKEIEVGLYGSNDMVEAVSGLEEGEKVILR